MIENLERKFSYQIIVSSKRLFMDFIKHLIKKKKLFKFTHSERKCFERFGTMFHVNVMYVGHGKLHDRGLRRFNFWKKWNNHGFVCDINNAVFSTHHRVSSSHFFGWYSWTEDSKYRVIEWFSRWSFRNVNLSILLYQWLRCVCIPMDSSFEFVFRYIYFVCWHRVVVFGLQCWASSTKGKWNPHSHSEFIQTIFLPIYS